MFTHLFLTSLLVLSSLSGKFLNVFCDWRVLLLAGTRSAAWNTLYRRWACGSVDAMTPGIVNEWTELSRHWIHLRGWHLQNLQLSIHGSRRAHCAGLKSDSAMGRREKLSFWSICSFWKHKVGDQSVFLFLQQCTLSCRTYPGVYCFPDSMGFSEIPVSWNCMALLRWPDW